MKTKIFCDSADYKTIKTFQNKSIVDGFTTNPSLMRLSGAKNYKNYSLKILKICKKKPISFEVFADTPKEMLKQAYEMNTWGKNVYVKIPVINSRGLFMGPVIKELSSEYRWFADLDEVRKDAMIDISFNLGATKLRKFVLALDAMERADYKIASDEFLNSDWSRTVKGRSVELASMIATGEYPE